jgi:hypothetical protein
MESLAGNTPNPRQNAGHKACRAVKINFKTDINAEKVKKT